MSEFSRVMEKMLILENGEKIMEDGLTTKDTSFLVKVQVDGNYLG